MHKFNKKFRIQSARLQNWYYGSAGKYFVTICTKNRKHFFGEIENEEMQLTEIGLIANSEWLKTKKIREDMNVELGEFIVMPDHFHGIIIIGKNKFNSKFQATTKNKFGPQSKNIGSIMRGFKSAVTTYARKNNIDFDWQDLYHDHIIRNYLEYLRISNYIKNNPKNWGKR